MAEPYFEQQPDGSIAVAIDRAFTPVPLADAWMVKVVYPDGRVEFLQPTKKEPA